MPFEHLFLQLLLLGSDHQLPQDPLDDALLGLVQLALQEAAEV
eukprot:CAMPEP_0115511030 /NCGR_PEP_ID=MMETSP0271-20121206/73747_1 /TAXON_ID=71861 /ORGANISM="Scrippsiella trochoidea, Strain CCMP3099" /LENGTH=42 /DNA_ID= /DNA_START= /DNA_END= /DNA_ORIENTATION=